MTNSSATSANLPATRPVGGRKPKYTADQVVAAIAGSGGIPSTIAKRLGVSTSAVQRYIARWPSARAALDAERDNATDAAESVILGSLAERNLDTAKWFLTKTTRGRARGYSDRQEVSGPDGTGLQITLVPWALKEPKEDTKQLQQAEQEKEETEP